MNPTEPASVGLDNALPWTDASGRGELEPLRDGHLCFYAGSGLSRGARLVGWLELAQRVERYRTEEEHVTPLLQGGDRTIIELHRAWRRTGRQRAPRYRCFALVPRAEIVSIRSELDRRFVQHALFDDIHFLTYDPIKGPTACVQSFLEHLCKMRVEFRPY